MWTKNITMNVYTDRGTNGYVSPAWWFILSLVHLMRFNPFHKIYNYNHWPLWSEFTRYLRSAPSLSCCILNKELFMAFNNTNYTLTQQSTNKVSLNNNWHRKGPLILSLFNNFFSSSAEVIQQKWKNNLV
jgi:hypothetical protein